MRPDEVLARRVAREIELEIESINRLRSELASAPAGDDTFALRARGSILHDFYTGVERVFVRPAVISTALAEELGEFLRFRHVFRNVYGFVLQADRLGSLQKKMPGVLEWFVTEMRVFLAWLTDGGAR